MAKPCPPELRIALHLHVYYLDLLPEMLKRLNGNQVRPDLFVSVPTESARDEAQKLLSETYSGDVIEIQIVPNCGRDIGPFLTAFGATIVDGYDVVGHIHTKKTADVKHSQMGKDWYTFLLENLLGGTSNMADIILGHLATDPSIGIIFPDDPHIVDWGRNRPYAEVLGQQMGINDLPENLLFPVGTMFWARVESLLPLFKLGLTWQDYPVEPLPYDGSVLHALERLLPLVASSQGFRSVLTNVTGITR
jgi:lipopolysaccharide biosynthesis protein